MRAEACRISRNSSSPVSSAASHATTPTTASAGRRPSSSSSHPTSMFAPTRVGAKSQASSTPRSSSQSATSSSRALLSSESSSGAFSARRAASSGSLATNARCSVSMGSSPRRTALADDSLKTSRASWALRPTAAAGLLSSWARPAAMMPREISFACFWETGLCTSDLPHVLVDELDGDRPLADRRGAALDRTVPLLARDGGDVGVQAHLYVIPILDLDDQVLGHALPQVVAAAEHDDLARLVGEEHRCLPGRVRPADDVDVLAPAREGLRLRRAVVDARAGEPVSAGHVQPAV